MAWLGLRRGSNPDSNHQPLAPVEKLKGYFDLAKVSSSDHACSNADYSLCPAHCCVQGGCVVNWFNCVALAAVCSG